MKLKHFVYIACLFIFLVTFGLLWIRLQNTFHIEAQNPIVFSGKTMLKELWESYKRDNIESTTNRTLDKQRNDVTTSEAESYTMLRAVFEDDKDTFDKSWKWTKDILQHKDDNLFAWLFGKKNDGSYGILTESGGNNTASDGDTDIALALIFAYSRWVSSDYLDQAKLILQDLWDKSVITVGDKQYILANNLEKFSINQNVIINPSYLEPYAYRIFAKVDFDHAWESLVDSSYDILNRSTEDQLDKTSSANLPPDWIYIDRSTGQIVPGYANTNLTSNFSYDALRIPWKIALDWSWYKDPRDKSYLDKLSFLKNEWKNKTMLAATYTHDGSATTQYESHAMYGGTIGYFVVSDPDDSSQIYSKQLQALYSPDKQSWITTLSYYDDNWVWFGMALYNSELPNLAANLK